MTLALILLACSLPPGESAPDSAVPERPPEAMLLEAADTGVLFALVLTPAKALLAAKVWELSTENPDVDCPKRAAEGEVVVLTGDCTTNTATDLTGSLRIHRAPDGGTWVFDNWTEASATQQVNWAGNIAWVQTDAANQLTAYEFSASEPAIGLDASYPGASFALDSSGRATSSAGVASLDVSGATLSLTLSGEWAYGGCERTPTSGFASWQAGELVLTARFDEGSCAGCIAWDAGTERGSWCAEN